MNAPPFQTSNYSWLMFFIKDIIDIDIFLFNEVIDLNLMSHYDVPQYSLIDIYQQGLWCFSRRFQEQFTSRGVKILRGAMDLIINKRPWFWGIAPEILVGAWRLGWFNVMSLLMTWWKGKVTQRLDSDFDTFLKGRLWWLNCVELRFGMATKCFHEGSISVMSWSVLLCTTIHIVMRFLVT